MHNSLISPVFSSSVSGALTLKVSVRFFTSLRETVGKKEETLEFSEGEKVTVDMVLKTLRQRYGNRFVEYVYDRETGTVRSFLQFLVNGKSASTLNGLQTELEDGDVLAILPPVGGG
jgi:molybdopterin synthase sulfur carrier subunit